ncbi:MAG TPA: outer membrane protein assembly factor BamD, partial [Acidobacteriota bacterium]|nr:outer membrane protein assembly factor BamD [Acidobacteriota bacterium]
FQSMHPTSEFLPFVTLRLGQAHFDQFSATDREQKNTEIAKGYFETVLSTYPNTPEAAEAKEKLAKAIEYLAEHEFNIAQFYLQQGKFPAARDRLEEIIRKYKATPTAVKSLYYLGESYRQEKNGVRAALAYEALIQHYPQSKYAADAKVQLAAVEKEKRDPLELVLMRDRRPGALSAPDVKEDPALAKLRDLNLIAKKDVVYEEPGQEKSFFSRVADKINPFSSSSSDNKDDKKPESALDIMVKANQSSKEQGSGFLSSLWPFGSKPTSTTAQSSKNNASNVVAQVDESLKQKGVDAAPGAVKVPEIDLPKVDVKPAPTMDTVALMSSIDANLKKNGTDPDQAPPIPEIAPGLRDSAVAQAAIATATVQPQAPQDIQTSGVLSSIDQKLKSQGVEPSQFQKPPTDEEIKAAAAKQKPAVKPVELEPKMALEKGPLFLSPSEMSQQDKNGATQDTKTADGEPEKTQGVKEFPDRILVKGPVQTPTTIANAKTSDIKTAANTSDSEPKGAFDQLRGDIDSLSKALNPFRW